MSEKKEKPFWMKTKFHYTVLILVVFAVITVSGVVVFSSDQVISFLELIFLGGVGGHTATKIASMFRKAS